MRTVVGGLLALSLVVVGAGPGLGASCTAEDPDGSKVALARATADQQCHDAGNGCDNAVSHGAYVSCVAGVVNELVAAGSLPVSCKGQVKRCAARSTCGKPGFVTCHRTRASGTTKCSIKRDASRCTAPTGGSACLGTSASCCDTSCAS